MPAFERRPAVTAVLLVVSALVLVFGTGATTAVDSATYDVVVIGAGPGGIGAAIQAAKGGAKVALIEESDWLGGHITAAAVGTMNEGSTAARGAGVYRDFARLVTQQYQAQRQSTHTCNFSSTSLCVSPSVAHEVLRQMLAPHTGIGIFLSTRVVATLSERGRVTGVVTSTGRRFASRVVIDATEFGDVLPLAGAEYRIGNGTSSQRSDATACVADFTYVAVIRRYPNGAPPELRVDTAPPGYTADIAREFATFVRDRGAAVEQGLALPLSFSSFVNHGGLPEITRATPYDPATDGGAHIDRTHVNLPNDVAASIRAVEEPAFRADSVCAAKLHTLHFLYYVQHDLGHTDWSIANDEGFAATRGPGSAHCPDFDGFEEIEQHFPVQPYVREGRRMIGLQTLTGHDIARDPSTGKAARDFADSVAVGYSTAELRRCGRPRDLEVGLDSIADLSGSATSGPFEVPMGALIPQRVDGLLAAGGNISASRIAASASRHQPVAFAVGQAAGALAALAASKNVAPRAVSAADVRARLGNSGARVDSAP